MCERGSGAGNTKVVVKAVKDETPAANAIVSAAQTGVKTITINTNFDASKSTVTLAKGSASVQIGTPAFSADGKTITISTTANLVASTYTVKVDDLTADVTAEASKVDKIEVLSDKAALANKDNNGKYQGATVGYQVLNQFGEDITKTVSLTVNASVPAVLSPSSHLIKFTASASDGFMLGRDIIVVSLLDTSSGKSTTANLSVSNEAYAAEITFAGVYNVDGKTLTEDTNFDNDPFYVLFEAKDQYGNKFNEYKQIKENNDLYLTVIGGLTALTKGTSGQNFIVLNKDGVDYLAYPLDWMPSMTPAVGKASIQVLSAGGGTCSGEIEVTAGARVDSITVSQNGVVVAGEENELSFTALDANGNEVTAYKQLRNVEINGGTTGTYGLAFERNADGTAKLVLDATNATVAKDQTAMQSFTFQTLNHKFSTVLITISENARPIAINGLRDVDTSISSKTTEIDVKVKNLVVEDQYGRILSAEKVSSMMNATTAGIYCLKDVSAEIEKTSVLKVTGAGITDAASKSALVTSNGAVNTGGGITKNFVLFKLKPQAKGTETVSFQIYNGGTDDKDQLADASTDVNFTVKDTTSATVAAATVKSVYVTTGGAATSNADAYAQNVEVKVGGALLSKADYTVEVPNGMAVSSGAVNNTDVWTVYATDGQDDIKEFKEKTATTLTRTLTITLNGTGEKFTTEVTLDRTAPTITTVSGLTGKVTPVSGSVITCGALLGSGATAPLKLEYERIADQYGKSVTVDANGTFTLEDGTTFAPTLTFECAVPLGEGLGAPKSLTDNNKSSASMTVETGFAGAGLTINFGGTTANVKILSVN